MEQKCPYTAVQCPNWHAPNKGKPLKINLLNLEQIQQEQQWDENEQPEDNQWENSQWAYSNGFDLNQPYVTEQEYDQGHDDNYDWTKGWEHLERENNPVILEVKMNGHKIGQSDILHPYEKVIQIRKNEILGLVGESGSGKTTLGKIIVGYPEYSTQRDSSVIYYDESGQGYNYTDYRIRKKLGYPIQIIHQDPQFSLNPNMTVKESLIESIKIGLVKIKGEYSSIDLNKSLNKYCDALAFSEKLLNKQIKTLSGGQQRRLGIGRVFALKPRVIIADEPVASLDSIIKNGILNSLSHCSLQFKVGVEFTY